MSRADELKVRGVGAGVVPRAWRDRRSRPTPRGWWSRILLGLLLVASAQAEGLRVTFVLHSPDLPADTAVYLTGSAAAIGAWDPAKVRMEPQGDHTWRKEVVLPAPVSLEYKYTLGSWEREGADATGAALPNFTVRVDGDREVRDRVQFWTTGRAARVNRGQVTGTVRYHRDVAGEGLAARDVIVWLPPGYAEDAAVRYPVLYMLDGQNIIDPATSSFGTDWSIDETADRMIRAGELPPFIVVGINSTAERTAEYTPGEKGAAHQRLLTQVVKPLIDATYRTRPGREDTFVGGSSAGGIAAFMLVWEQPEVFAGALCLSPAFRPPAGYNAPWNYVRTVAGTKTPPRGVRFYIDNGGVGLDSSLQPGVDEMLAALRAHGYREGEDFVFILAREARHDEAAWAVRMPGALRWLWRSGESGK